MLLTDVILPFSSTLNVGICVDEPYEPAFAIAFGSRATSRVPDLMLVAFMFAISAPSPENVVLLNFTPDMVGLLLNTTLPVPVAEDEDPVPPYFAGRTPEENLSAFKFAIAAPFPENVLLVIFALVMLA
jgi:hypothetical protein